MCVRLTLGGWGGVGGAKPFSLTHVIMCVGRVGGSGSRTGFRDALVRLMLQRAPAMASGDQNPEDMDVGLAKALSGGTTAEEKEALRYVPPQTFITHTRRD
jgi:hypothetical protein